MTGIFKQLQATGLPLSNHCSDLYVEVNEQTRAIIEGYEYKTNVTTFTDQHGKLSYEIPFAYDYKKLGDL